MKPPANALHVSMEQVSLADLLPLMEAQAARMSVKNPARRVLWSGSRITPAMRAC